MATIVKSLICSDTYWNALAVPYQATFSAHYTTPALWFAAAPADLRAGTGTDQIWQGQVGKEEFVAVGNQLAMTGKLANATNYFEFMAEPGSSIFDSRLNALRYDGTKGAAFKVTGPNASAVSADIPYTRVHGIQFAGTDQTGSAMAPLALGTSAGDFFDVDRVLCESYSNSQAAGFSTFSIGPAAWGDCSVKRSLFIYRGSVATARVVWSNFNTNFSNCVFASTNVEVGSAIYSQYAGGTIKNSAIMNVTAPTSGGALTATTCATSAVGSFAGFASVPYSGATFNSVATNGTHDFSTVTGSGLINAGTADAGVPADVTGQAWVGGTDIGLWDFSAAGGTAGTAPGGTGTSAGTGTGGIATGGAGGTGSFTSDAMENNSGAGLLASVTVNWTWYQGSIGAAPTSMTHGSGTTNSSGILSLTGLPLGAGFLLVRTTDSAGVYYQPGTVA